MADLAAAQPHRQWPGTECDVGAAALFVLGKRVHDYEEDQQRSQRLERTDEEIAKNADDGEFGNDDAENGAENEAGDDTLDQTDAVPGL